MQARHILIPIDGLGRGAGPAVRAGRLAGGLAAQARGAAGGARDAARRSATAWWSSAEQPFVPGVGSALEALEWARDEAKPATQTAETVSPLFETPQAFYMAQREAFTPAGTMSLQEATPQIRRQLIREKKEAQAREIGQQMVAEVRERQDAGGTRRRSGG